jgi:hypothetical protein
MYKGASKFHNRVTKAGRRFRFNTKLSSSDHMSRPDSPVDPAPKWRNLIRRLDAEVARVNPTSRWKTK